MSNILKKRTLPFLLILSMVFAVMLNFTVPQQTTIHAAEKQKPSVTKPIKKPRKPTPTPTVTITPTPSPSLTLTPTPSTTVQTNCRFNPSNCGYPDATNTGVPAGITLTKVTGDMTIRTAGTVIEGKDIEGCVVVDAPGVTIKNTRITCDGYYGILTADQAVAQGAIPLTIQDVEIVCGGNTTGIAYANLTVQRVYVHGCENGFSLDRDASVTDSYVTDIKEVNGGHGDGMQFGGSVANIVINHNSIIVGEVTSAVNWTGNTISMVVENNLLSGGGYTIYCPRVLVPSGAFKVLNNRFGDFVYGHQDSCDMTGVVFTGNYRDSDLSPINP